ncbi:protein TIFY 9 isoform X2 [Cryptomeria japonica]|uniref:protein TIFY 9 isoform X2 n=1 Tax=Cryptomeria japonica TaxID=3369 RepID=UPI0027DA8F5F|nr:protein TIFY 9 isoform X2 [Cryptomeria japonica]
MSQPELLTIDFLGIGSDKNDSPQLDSAMDCHQQRRSMQSCLRKIKPHMLQQVLSQECFSNSGFSPAEIHDKVSEGIKTLDLFPQHSLGFQFNGKQDKYQLPLLDTQIEFPKGAAAMDFRPPTEQSSSQLTIFSSGTVNVYSDISSGKAGAIMMLAAAGSGKASPSDQSVSSTFVSKISNSLPVLRILRKELPMAKKLSLQRFLEKRKDRLNRLLPYLSSSKNSSLVC